MSDRGKMWCILRTGSAQTLPLCKALCDDGFAAWTPTEVIVKRARRDHPRAEVTVALMPSIVFAGYEQVSDLITLSRTALPHMVWDATARRHVARGWPQFRVLRIANRFARVADGDLAGLRRAESVGMTLAKRKTFVPGVTVRLMEADWWGWLVCLGEVSGVSGGVEGGVAFARNCGGGVIVCNQWVV